MTGTVNRRIGGRLTAHAPAPGGGGRRQPRVARAPSLGSLLCALAASAVLAGCGEGAVPPTASTQSPTTVGTGTSSGLSQRAPAGRGESVAKPLTAEEMREYDANEGRCHDDGGSVRDVGTVNAYCAFPARSNDFHLIESSRGRVPSGVEE